MLIAALFVSFSFVACDKDEADDIEDLENLNVTVTTNVDRQSSKTVGTAKAKGYFTYTVTAVYKDDTCTSFKVEIKCESKSLADSMWADLIEDEDPQYVKQYYKRDGKTITADLTDEFGEMPRQHADYVIEEMMHAIKAAYSDNHDRYEW